ncbi:hypothetical protein [Saccharibacillus sacchari]|uniref:hypothetical protein n=1 Tax=Saccharibacillus sacchari TaxID=456493 RepID=UPI000568DE2E|nr:hypothetical protein [Saccharibacillus sacchari]
MTDQKEIFINHWEARSESYLSLREPAIREVWEYTKERLTELRAYLNTIKENRRTDAILGFYREHVELLSKDYQREIKEYPGNYMYFYNELLLGSERYLTIKNELKNLGCKVKEEGSNT